MPLNKPANTSNFQLLYNTQAYHQMMGSLRYKSYQFEHSEWAFSIENETAYAPYKGTFAGPEYSIKTTIEQLISDFQRLLQTLKAENIRKIRIKLGTDAYYHLNEKLYQAILENQTEKASPLPIERAFIIPINQSINDYLSNLSISKQREYRNALIKKHSFQIESTPSPAEIQWYYEKVKQSREIKARPFNQDYQSFTESILKLPDNYKIATVRNKAKDIIAFSIIVNIHPKSVYTLYTVTLPEYKKENVQSLLHGGIYNYALERKLSFIDLGTSTAEGVLNKGLEHFKKSLGGQCQLRYGLEINF